MPNIGIVGAKEISAAFVRILREKQMYQDLHVHEGLGKFDVLVVAQPLSLLRDIGLSEGTTILINSDEPNIFPLLAKGGRYITYGFNNRASITATSITEDALQVCIQRAFPGISGKMQYPREFSAKNIGEEPANLLAAAAAFAVFDENI